MLEFLKNKLRDFYFKRRFYIVENNKKIFSIRKFGGATSGRGKNFFDKEPETVKWINSFNKNSNFLDIGANVGIYSLYAASKDINVVSFEPESSNYYQLNLNIIDNNFTNRIKAYPFSAGKNFELGNLDLGTLKVGGSGHNFLSKKENSFDERGLFSQGSIGFSIDYYIELSNFIPNFIKIDVDGNEALVVEGMKNTLKNNELKSILLEVNHKFDSHIKAMEIIKNNNFEIVKKEKYDFLTNYIFSR
jgi:FkbM family methyltransferase